MRHPRRIISDAAWDARSCVRGARPVSTSSDDKSAMTDFAFHVTENSDGPVVLLAGDLDIESGPRLEECLHVLSGQHVALDFSDVHFMDSSAVGVLVAAYNRASDQGGSVRLLGVQPPQMALFQLTGVANYLGLYRPTPRPRTLSP